MDVYERLQEKFATHPLGAPRNEKFLEILNILFAPQEAELATHLGFWPARSSDIAEAAGMSEEHAVQLCERMADKGIVYGFQVRDERRYCLLPTAPGLFEFPFMIRDREVKMALDWQRLGQLWEEYYHDGWGHELSSSPTPAARVLPIGKAISTDLRVFPFEEAARYIREARYIGLSDCPCRTSKPSCDAPVDVCLTFNYTAKFLDEREAARLIPPEQALAVLQRADDSGLVHCTTNTADRIDYICNCCSCCCGAMNAWSEGTPMLPLPATPPRLPVRLATDAARPRGTGDWGISRHYWSPLPFQIAPHHVETGLPPARSCPSAHRWQPAG